MSLKGLAIAWIKSKWKDANFDRLGYLMISLF